jgi:hypothetical protein
MKEIEFPVNFRVEKRLAYRLLLHDSGAKILVGFTKDRSMDPESFYFHYFVQCLYVPFTTLNLSLGDRLGGLWTGNTLPQLNSEIHHFKKLDSLCTFEDFLNFSENHPYYGHEVGQLNCLALTHYILGNYTASLKYLQKISDFKNHTHAHWFAEEISNSDFLMDCMATGDYEKGMDQILKWQEQTMHALKLKLI